MFAEVKPPRINPLPDRFLDDIMKADHLVWGFTSKYELQIVNPEGKTVRKILKDYEPVKVTERDKEKMIRDQYGEKGAPPDVNLEWPTNFSPMYSLLVDDQDRIFVRTNARDARGHFYYDVFSPEGICFLNFTLPEEEIPMAIRNGKMYCLINEGEEGVPQVKRSALEWK